MNGDVKIEELSEEEVQKRREELAESREVAES